GSSRARWRPSRRRVRAGRCAWGTVATSARRSRPATTACCSTPPAPASARCAGAPRRGGGAPPATSPPWPRCSGRCWPPRWRRCARAGWSPTSPARRTRRRPCSSSTTCCGVGTTSSSWTPRRRCGLRQGATSPTWGRGGRRSCGRTGTAPTRCSWPCCAAGPTPPPAA
ncbi:MAG: 16S rRNA (cytosine(967)-C(5))-methyltransferase, partial [uncultured Quadrisphaera sp.]